MLDEAPVSFSSEGATLRGLLLTPPGDNPRLPAVVMAHGTTASIRMVAIEYARVFARSGLAVLLYDHRNFASSDGEPRQEINPWVQTRGYLDALSFASSRPEIDPDRIGLWGDSYSGGHVIVAAACDPRPKVVVAQIPVFGATTPSLPPSADTLAAIKATLLGGDVTGTPETTTGSAVSAVSADIAKNIQSFVDEEFDIIVTVGFAAGGDTIAAAKANPSIKFIGVDQQPCVTADAVNDPTFACAGDAATLLPNLQGIGWKEQQPGYLAGIVAASISKSGHIAGIGGTAVIPAVTNYLIGYRNGAMSVNPSIKVELQYISAAPDKLAFADSPAGKAFAQQLLGAAANKDIDVVFQVAGLTGNGVLEAVCEAKIHGIGVDVDQYISTPNTKACTVVSAEKKLLKNVSDAIVRIKDGTDKGGSLKLDLTTDDVGLSPFHEFESLITADVQKLIDDAVAGMKAGTLNPCELNAFGGCDTTK